MNSVPRGLDQRSRARVLVDLDHSRVIPGAIQRPCPEHGKPGEKCFDHGICGVRIRLWMRDRFA
ncbi:hypothetical protein [Agromyces sp. NPDC058064]|uniref:hypothetical protein n=1 Tax=Agromyces sp. NPDC058064 TaxID=3346322 RepID=UPI0036DF74CE